SSLKPKRWSVIFVVTMGGLAMVIGLNPTQPPDPQSPLAGEFSHDFGEHVLTGRILELPHTFPLVNRSGETIEILKVTSSCGCTHAKVSQSIVQPGETVLVSATLDLGVPGRRQENIWLNLGKHGVQTLYLSGAARRAHDFYVSHGTLRLTRAESQEIILVATNLGSDTEPPEPKIAVPPGVNFSIDGWRLVHTRDEELQRPARWQAIVELERTADNLPSRSKLVVQLSDGQEASIDLTGWPWR
ncbi:MAG: DUF1573 domain-containing protein, partial [Alphaproteobacteria bacterium]|nr:DUF1573 domain-containing protein [Alphaproteobacteria bacterium]